MHNKKYYMKVLSESLELVRDLNGQVFLLHFTDKETKWKKVKWLPHVRRCGALEKAVHLGWDNLGMILDLS